MSATLAVAQLAVTDTSITVAGIIAVFVLMFLSAFFSSAEIAMFAFPRHRLETLVAEGNPGALRVDQLRSDPHRLLVTILVGNNIANIAMSSVATTVLAIHFSPGVAVLIATLGITSLVLVFSESAPKSYAVTFTERWAMRIARPLRIAEYLMYPLVSIFDAITGVINRLTGANIVDDEPITRAELRQLIEASDTIGVLEPAEVTYLERILTFTDVPVGAVDTPRSDTVAVPIDATIDEAIEAAVDAGHAHLPVYRETMDDVAGVVWINDLIKVSRKSQESDTIGSHLRPIEVVPETKPLGDLITTMRERRLPMVAVVDEFGSLEGIATIEDIVEVIVGDILGPTEPAQIIELTDDQYRVRGDMLVDRLNEVLNTDLPTGPAYQTVGGLVMDALGGPAEPGDSIDIDDVTIVVDAVEDQRITAVRVRS